MIFGKFDERGSTMPARPEPRQDLRKSPPAPSPAPTPAGVAVETPKTE
jgi:hypothetical protein